jgi:hypothetical protein
MTRPARGTILAAAGLAALLGLVLVTAPRWTKLMSRTVPGEEGEEPASPPPAEERPAADAQGQITVKLFFHASDRDGLLIEERAVPYSADLAVQLRAVVEELVKGPRSGLVATLAPDTRVLDVFVSPQGVAYVDLSAAEAMKSVARGGSDAELMTVYSIVNTLTSNFPAVRRVQILLDDRPASTFAGHVDLMRPLGPDLQWLATNIMPSPSPSPAPVPATP